MAYAREKAGEGTIVIVYGADGTIQDVLGVGVGLRRPIRKAPIKRRLRDRDINIAIAKALENA